jgi:hypothetical protein
MKIFIAERHLKIYPGLGGLTRRKIFLWRFKDLARGSRDLNILGAFESIPKPTTALKYFVGI